MPPQEVPAAPSRMRRAARPKRSTRSSWPRKKRARGPRKRSQLADLARVRSRARPRGSPHSARLRARPRRINPGAARGRQPRRPPPAAPIRRPTGAPSGGQSADALRRPPMRPAIVNKRLPQPPGARREAPKRRSDKVDVGRAVEGENDFAAGRRRRCAVAWSVIVAASTPASRSRRSIARSPIPETITVQELAKRMSERSADVVKTLMSMGVMATINQAIDADTAELVGDRVGPSAQRVAEGDVEIGLDGERRCAGDAWCRGRRSSPSWATSITARPRCSTRCAPGRCRGPRSGRHHPAYRRLSGDRAVGPEDHLPRHAGPRRPSPRCARAAPT